MKLKMKFTLVLMTFLLSIFMLVIGVVCASQASVTMKGTVSFVANDVYAKVTGNVSGAQETVSLSELNFSATYEPKEELNSWKNLELNFLNKSSIIKIEITIENLSSERSILVSLSGDIALKNNVKKALKHDGNPYTSATEFELKVREKTTLTIEMNVANTNNSVTKAPFDYTLNLNNPQSKDSNTTENYKVECSVASEDYVFDFIKCENPPIEGTNIYEINCEGDVYGYVDFSESDIANIKSGAKLTMIFYVTPEEFTLTINGEEKILTSEEGGEYCIYTIEHTVTQNVSIEILSELDFVFI